MFCLMHLFMPIQDTSNHKTSSFLKRGKGPLRFKRGPFNVCFCRKAQNCTGPTVVRLVLKMTIHPHNYIYYILEILYRRPGFNCVVK